MLIDIVYYLPQPLPRKGTETAVEPIHAPWMIAEFATTFTPQGDGNQSAAVAVDILSGICHNLYPARGRKR